MILTTSSRRRRRRRGLVAAVVAVIVLVALAVSTGALAIAERGAIPHGVTIGGVAVGGMSEANARAAVTGAARQQTLEPVAMEGAGETVSLTGAQLGARPLIEPALAAARDVGLLDRLSRRLGLGDDRHVHLVFALDPDRVKVLADALESRVSVAPTDARLVVRVGGSEVRPSEPGRVLDRPALTALLSELPPRLDVPVRAVPAKVGTRAANRAKRTVDALLSSPRTIVSGTTAVELSPATLATLVRTEPDAGALRVTVDADALGERLRPRFGALERPPRDASFRISDNGIRVVPAAPGRRLDLGRIGASLLANTRATVHRGRFVALQPSLTTRRAEALQIREVVSEFTTYYPCCAPRVSNIQRAAQVLDGTIIQPGGRFSLNETLGQRTEAAGYVEAPQIRAGRLEDAVGGGISQVATTLYNAAFFAGLELIAHTPHQFYISRYPMGREATVSWGGPELIFRNDWPAGVLMRVTAGDTYINVRFYSSRLGRNVTTETAEPTDYEAPTTNKTVNPSLEPGTTDVLQEAGASGFTVRYTRRVTVNGKVKRNESFAVRYDPQDAYIEVGPKPKPTPKPKATPKSPGQAGEQADEATPAEPEPTVP